MEYPTTMLDFMHQFPDDVSRQLYVVEPSWTNDVFR